MIATLAKMLALSDDQAEASMFSEGAARALLGRRGLLAVGAAMATGTLFSFGHPAMSMREFQDLMRASLPGRQLSFERGWDIFRDMPGDPELVTTVISGGNRKTSKFSIDLRHCDSSPFVRESLRRSLARHVGQSASCFG